VALLPPIDKTVVFADSVAEAVARVFFNGLLGVRRRVQWGSAPRNARRSLKAELQRLEFTLQRACGGHGVVGSQIRQVPDVRENRSFPESPAI
jgi:hypothetical protein